MRRKWAILIGITSLLLLAGSPHAGAAVITFDDLPSIPNDPIANGYAGFNWSNMWAFDPVASGYDQNNGAGYVNGVVSPSNDAYNGFAAPAIVSRVGTFDFSGAWFTSAWNNNNVLTLTGKANGNPLYTLTATLTTSGPMWVDANFTGIDELDLSTSSLQFAMDDFTYSAGNTGVPEPSALVLMSFSLLSLAGVRRRVKK